MSEEVREPWRSGPYRNRNGVLPMRRVRTTTILTAQIREANKLYHLLASCLNKNGLDTGRNAFNNSI